MSRPGKELTNREMEAIIGDLLRTGVIIAAAVVLLGGTVYLFRQGAYQAGYGVFQRVPYDLCSVKGILKSAFAFHGRGLIQLGLLLLIATPIARVALSILVFARQRDTLYVAITSVVLVILLHSLSGR